MLLRGKYEGIEEKEKENIERPVLKYLAARYWKAIIVILRYFEADKN